MQWYQVSVHNEKRRKILIAARLTATVILNMKNHKIMQPLMWQTDLLLLHLLGFLWGLHEITFPGALIGRLLCCHTFTVFLKTRRLEFSATRECPWSCSGIALVFLHIQCGVDYCCVCVLCWLYLFCLVAFAMLLTPNIEFILPRATWLKNKNVKGTVSSKIEILIYFLFFTWNYLSPCPGLTLLVKHSLNRTEVSSYSHYYWQSCPCICGWCRYTPQWTPCCHLPMSPCTLCQLRGSGTHPGHAWKSGKWSDSKIPHRIS